MFKQGKRILAISLAGFLAFQSVVPVQAEESVSIASVQEEQTEASEDSLGENDEAEVEEEKQEDNKDVKEEGEEVVKESQKEAEVKEEKTSEKPEIKAEAGDYAYDVRDLKNVSNWGATVTDKDGKFLVNFTAQYQHSFYAIPEEIDPRRIEAVSVETSSTDKFSLKLCLADNSFTEAAVVYNSAYLPKSKIDSKINVADIKVVDFMSLLDGESSYEIGKVTFTLSEEIVDADDEEENDENVRISDKAGDYVFEASELNYVGGFGNATGEVVDGKYIATFPDQYAQLFYELPEGLDPARIEKVTVDTDSSYFSIKLAKNDADFTQVAVTYGSNSISKSNIPADADVSTIKTLGFMSLQEKGSGSLEKVIGKITFTLSAAKKADEGSTPIDGETLKAGTYKFKAADLTIKSTYGATVEALEDGSVHVNYEGQYRQVYFAIPENIPVTKIASVTFDTPAADCSVKIMGTTNDDTIAKVVYGQNGLTLTGEEENLADATIVDVMNMNSGAAQRVIKSVTFVIVDRVVDTTKVTGDLTADCFKDLGNVNPIVTQRYSADPGVMVYDDTVYIYSTNDIYEYKGNGSINENSYSKIKTINCYSSKDLVNWTDHGAIPVAGKNGGNGPATWANNSWAPAAAHKTIDGKEKFFLYFADNGSGVGVLTSDSPTGPWTDPLGKQLISRSTPTCANITWLFDPAVMVDDDGTGYLVFGGGVPDGKAAHPMNARVVKLGDDMISLAGDPVVIDAPYLFEDSGINKIGDKYVYSYCSNWNCQAPFRSGTIQYMIADDPMGPYEYVSEIFANPSSFFNDGNGNNHHSLFEFKGKYYIAYHARALERKAIGKALGYRTTQIDEVTVKDGKIQTITATMKGVSQVGNLNPYETQEATTIYRQKGIEVFESGDTVLTVTAGDFTSVKGADFAKGTSALEITIKADEAMTIDAFVGSENGSKLGTIKVEATDGKFETFRAEVANVTGVSDLYFVYNGAAEVKSWKAEPNIVETVIEGKDMTLVNRWNAGDTKTNKLSFASQYQEYVYTLEEPIATAGIQSIVVKVKDQEKTIAVKMYDEAGTEAFVNYGVNGAEEYTFNPTFDGKVAKIAFMAMADAKDAYPYGITIEKIIITSVGKATVNVGEEVILITGEDLKFFEHWTEGAPIIGNVLEFSKKWDEYAIDLGRTLDMDRCKSITFNVKDQGNNIAFKTYAAPAADSEDGKDVELQPFYDKRGAKSYTINPTDGKAYRLAVMGTADEGDGVYPYSVTIESIKIVMDTTEKPVVEKGVEYDIVNLRDAVAETMGDDFLIGTAASYDEFRDNLDMELVFKHFNALTLGNELKPDAILKSGAKINQVTLHGKTFDFPELSYTTPESRLDLVLAHNEKNPDKKIKVRGHVLVWHSQMPTFFFREGYSASGAYVSKELMNLRLEYYIKSVAEHFTGADSKYKDLFYGWDVVNEAVDDGSGSYRTTFNGKTTDWWAIYKSQEFITNAFVYANRYMAPNVELYYNDYNDTQTNKVKGIEQLLRDVKNTEGARIDGFGMQAHYDVNNPTMEAFMDAARRYTAIVDSVQVTELDFKGATSSTDEKLAKRYADVYNAIRRLRDEGVNFTAMTIWGVTDKHSWLQSQNNVGGGSTSNSRQYPLLFDDNYKAKNSFWAIVNAGELMPEIKTVTITKAVDDDFSAGKVHTFKMGDKVASFIPEYDAEKESIRIKVFVPDTEVNETDAVTVYLSYNGKNVKEVYPIPRGFVGTETKLGYIETKEVTDGYEVIFNAAIEYPEEVKKNNLTLDIVVTDDGKAFAFNDTRIKQETSTAYYAKTVYKSSEVVTKGTVTIDGEGNDNAWADATEIYLAINNGAKAEAKAKLLWDENYLYVLTTVKDAVLDDTASAVHEKDSVELFVDENNGKTTSYEDDDKQYRINYKNEQSFNGTKCLAENIVSAVKLTEDGYVVEAALKWTDIEAKHGVNLGFDAQVNDAEKGARLGTLIWADETGNGWSSPAGFGTIILVDSSKAKLEVVDEKGKLYITKGDEKLVNTGLEFVDGKYYYVTANGSLLTDKFDQKVTKVGESVEYAELFLNGYYWFTKDGSMFMEPGIVRVNQKNDSYLLKNGAILKDTGMEFADGCYYYVSKNGKLMKNTVGFKATKIGKSIENPSKYLNKSYFFDGNCIMVVPFETYVYSTVDGRRFILKNGVPLRNTGLEYINGFYYYTQSNGVLVTDATNFKIAKVGSTVKNSKDFLGKKFDFGSDSKMILK